MKLDSIYKIYTDTRSMGWTSTPYDIYVKHRDEKAKVFCNRFPGGIDFKRKTVLEVGCGHGSLCLYAVQRGAKRVYGIDLNERRIDLAKNRLVQEFGQYTNFVQFKCADVQDLETAHFDMILSQATFEHLLNPEAVLCEMKRRLPLGGKIYLGFGPLWNAPWGDHRRTKVPFQSLFPWAHLVFPDSWIVRNLNKKNPLRPITSFEDLGLSRYSLRQYIELFEAIDLDLTFCEVNRTESFIGPILNILRRVPGLNEYLSFNLYCVLERR